MMILNIEFYYTIKFRVAQGGLVFFSTKLTTTKNVWTDFCLTF